MDGIDTVYPVSGARSHLRRAHAHGDRLADQRAEGHLIRPVVTDVHREHRLRERIERPLADAQRAVTLAPADLRQDLDRFGPVKDLEPPAVTLMNGPGQLRFEGAA